jgi:hypothetical protein
MTIVVNFLAGPGTGKSTIASDVFSRLKKTGIESELASEFAKDLVWSQDLRTLKNQIYVFANQFERIDRLIGKVDVVVTDSPLLLSTMFKNHRIFEYPFINDTFDKLVLQVNNIYNNLNYFIKRTVPFNPVGRIEKSVEEAIENDNKIKKVLLDNSISFKSITNSEENIQYVMDDIMRKLK